MHSLSGTSPIIFSVQCQGSVPHNKTQSDAYTAVLLCWKVSDGPDGVTTVQGVSRVSRFPSWVVLLSRS